jgi:hypothetical protein
MDFVVQISGGDARMGAREKYKHFGFHALLIRKLQFR